MNSQNVISFVFACLLVLFGAAGCVTTDSDSTGNTGGNAGVMGNVKSQGVYTTLAIPDMGLVMPARGCIQKTSFGPGETPAAVIVGYGTPYQQQSVSLQLIESDTGRILMSKDYYASYRMCTMQPLPIRLGGQYQIKLSSGGALLDTWDFAVMRTNATGPLQVDHTTPDAKYGEGTFGVEITGLSDAFSSYDDNLIYYMVNAITKEASSATNEDLFAQRFPGKVVMQCRLDFQGHLTDPKILENTMDGDCAAMFQKALLERSPYDAWPEDVHQKFGSDYRDLKLTINFD